MNFPSPYRPGREIARGGMGAVLAANDAKFGRSVAMKVMLRRQASEEEEQRFLQEARVLGQLAHPNIVPVHDVGKDEQGRLFYTMKLVQGVTLHEVIGRLKDGDPDTLAKYPLAALLTIFQKVCDAVGFAHSRGVIHRDLKPQNIMVGEFGEVLVMDWGLAKILPDSAAAAEAAKTPHVRGYPGHLGPTGTLPIATAGHPAAGAGTAAFSELRSDEMPTVIGTGDSPPPPAPALPPAPLPPPAPAIPVLEPTAASGTYATLEGAVMGTPHYMSPEQADGKIAELDGRSDIFSLGGILYALLTLRPPVEGESVAEILSKVRSGTIAPPTDFNTPSSNAAATHAATTGTTLEPKKKIPLAHCPGGKVPGALSAVTMKALTRDKARRYQTVAEFTADIAAYQGGFATGAENAGAFTQLWLFIRRHQVLSAAAVVIVLLTAFFITRLSHARDVAETNAELARKNAAQAKLNEEKAVAEFQRATTAELAAKNNEQKATQSAEIQRREAARARVLLADAAFLASDLPRMVQALEQCPEDLREQTWEYLSAKRDASVGALQVPGFERPTALAAVPGQPGVFALAAANGDIALVNAVDGAVRRVLKTGRGGVHLLACAPNGTLLAVARRGSAEVELFTLADGQRWKTVSLGQDNVHWLAVVHHPNHSLLTAIGNAPATAMSTLELVDLQSGTRRWEIKRRGGLSSALPHPDGDKVLVCGSGQLRSVLTLDARDGSERTRVDVFPLTQALSPNGRLLAVGSVSGEILLLNTATGAVVQRGKLHSAFLANVAWLGNSHLLTMGTEGKFADARWVFRLVEAQSLASRGSFFGLKQGQLASAWSLQPDSGDLLTLESPPRRWRFPVGRELARLTHDSEQAWGGVFASDNRLVARKSFGLALYNDRLAEQPGTPAWDFHLAASHPASGQFALARLIRGMPPGLKVFTAAAAAAPVEKFNLPTKALAHALAFDAAGSRLVVVTRDGALEAFSLTDGRSLYRTEPAGRFERAVFAGTNLFAIAAYGSTVEKVDYRLERIDAATGQVRATLKMNFPINALAVSADERLLAFAGGDRYVYFAHVEPRPDGRIQERNFFRAHDGEIGALAFHPTQSILATAAVDGAVKLWDHRDPRQPLEFFLGLEGMPVTLSFSPSGNRLLVDGQERTTRIYDVTEVKADKP